MEYLGIEKVVILFYGFWDGVVVEEFDIDGVSGLFEVVLLFL